MQLHEVFAAGDLAPPPTKAVTFRVMPPARPLKGPPAAPREIQALLCIVDEPETSAALRDAEVALSEQYRDSNGVPVQLPPSARSGEQTYHFLFRALRDPQNPIKPLAQTVLELRRALEPITARRLVSAYNAWIDEEFPDTISAKALEKLEDEAEGK